MLAALIADTAVVTDNLPAAGALAAVGAMLRMMRNNERGIRADFAQERDRLRLECAKEREADRLAIEALRRRCDRLEQRPR